MGKRTIDPMMMMGVMGASWEESTEWSGWTKKSSGSGDRYSYSSATPSFSSSSSSCSSSSLIQPHICARITSITLLQVQVQVVLPASEGRWVLQEQVLQKLPELQHCERSALTFGAVTLESVRARP